MKPVVAPTNEAVRPQTRTDRVRNDPARKRILKDSRQAAKGYTIAFNVPESGE